MVIALTLFFPGSSYRIKNTNELALRTYLLSAYPPVQLHLYQPTPFSKTERYDEGHC